MIGRLLCRLGWHRWYPAAQQNFAHFPTHVIVTWRCRRCLGERTEIGHLHP